MVVDKANPVLDQASPTMQATKDKGSEQVSSYLKKNSEARLHQMVSTKDKEKFEAVVETEEVQIDKSSPNKKVRIGSGLEESFREELVSLLWEYKYIFSWCPRDMPELHESIAMHSLDVNPNKKPIKQKRRNFDPERQKAIDEEGKVAQSRDYQGNQVSGVLENVFMVKKSNKKWYPRLEKFAFALVTTSRKLRHYFQGREIRVVINQSLRKIIHKPDISGRLVNWDVELSQFNLSFIPRTAIKAQALADFIIECNFPEEPEPKNIDLETDQAINPGAWTLKVDGSSTSERSGAGLILTSHEGFMIETTISFSFPATNNQAEYEALIAGLKISRTLKVQDLKIYSDSHIVVKQTNREYIANDPILEKYQALVQSYLASIPGHQVLQLCREENEEADILSKLVRNSSDLDCSVYFEELQKPSINSEEVLEIESNQIWMTPFINYLEKGELPEDKGKAQTLKATTAKFFIEEGLLYLMTFSSPILKYVGPEEANYCLMEVHEEICGDHMSAKALAHKIIRQGYYWPTIHKDAVEFVKKIQGMPTLQHCIPDKPSPTFISPISNPLCCLGH
ncbi:uncharacterized protein LOC141704443 [Apium graveolens]|uniref:uncharacterized protein LOC141704443 n=1 Tax=Apium graveolens TaxID=4045 RepID=UPI003D7A0873